MEIFCIKFAMQIWHANKDKNFKVFWKMKTLLMSVFVLMSIESVDVKLKL